MDLYRQVNSSPPNLIISILHSLQEIDLLFDYCTPITEDIFVANGPSRVFRRRTGDKRLRRTRLVGKRQAMNGEMPGFDFEPVLDITGRRHLSGTRYEVASSRSPPLSSVGLVDALDELPFICLSTQELVKAPSSHPIVKDDVIKLGKTYFRVMETHLSRGDRDLPLSCLDASFSPASNPSGLSCRICLSEGGDDLISPCDCRGSCQFVHFSCLQTWIQCKVRREENRLVDVYSLARLECELCKRPLSNRMVIAGQAYSLVQFEWPRGPFMVLEKLPTRLQTARTFMVLSLKEGEVRIGRWPTMDLQVQDIALSREHSSIEFREGQFWLRDKGSKFGSLILLRGAVEVTSVMCLQAGSKIYRLEPQQSRILPEMIDYRP